MNTQTKVILITKKLDKNDTISNLSTPEPLPEQNNLPAVWDLVIDDMKARDQFGVDKYHMHLQPFNGRDALKDMYQELLDACVYARQMLYERDRK